MTTNEAPVGIREVILDFVKNDLSPAIYRCFQLREWRGGWGGTAGCVGIQFTPDTRYCDESVSGVLVAIHSGHVELAVVVSRWRNEVRKRIEYCDPTLLNQIEQFIHTVM
jgi:hypothetical protein